jgi:hypothetical protein
VSPAVRKRRAGRGAMHGRPFSRADECCLGRTHKSAASGCGSRERRSSRRGRLRRGTPRPSQSPVAGERATGSLARRDTTTRAVADVDPTRRERITPATAISPDDLPDPICPHRSNPPRPSRHSSRA